MSNSSLFGFWYLPDITLVQILREKSTFLQKIFDER